LLEADEDRLLAGCGKIKSSQSLRERKRRGNLIFFDFIIFEIASLRSQ
jgi:hypothetical protein